MALAASFAVVPGISYAAASAAAPSAADTTPAAASTSSTNSTQTDAAAAKVDKRTQEWAKNRPEDKALEDGSRQYEGQTIVDTLFEGTTALTESTAKAAISESKIFRQLSRRSICNLSFIAKAFPPLYRIVKFSSSSEKFGL